LRLEYLGQRNPRFAPSRPPAALHHWQPAVAHEPPSDALVQQELDAIVERLAALASTEGDADAIGEELGAIRAQLRLLAKDNAEVGARLGEILGLRQAD
jgi:hypothetical protein